jgi:hypothetical protein
MLMRAPMTRSFEPGGDVLARRPAGIIPLRPGTVTTAGRDLVRRRHQFYKNISYHEAGHVTVGLLCGAPIAGATILAVDGWHGRTWHAADRDEPAFSVADIVASLVPLMPTCGDDRVGIAPELVHASDQVIGLLAGVESERLFTDAPLPRTEHDEAEARLIAGLVCRQQRSVDAFIEFARAEARGLLLEHQDLAMLIAAALLERCTLTGAEIDAIITDRRR